MRVSDTVFMTAGPSLMPDRDGANSVETPRGGFYDGPPKRCTACGEIKARTEFYLRRRSPDGLCYECKACGAKRARDYNARKTRERHATNSNPNGKACAECREFKGWDDFDVSYMQPDGRQKVCKLCQAERVRAREIAPLPSLSLTPTAETPTAETPTAETPTAETPTAEWYTLQDWLELAQVPSIFVAESVACWLISEKLARICTLDGSGAPSPVAVEIVPWAVAMLLGRPAPTIRGQMFY